MIADLAIQMVEPQRVRCIGVDLQPYSLGHYFILRAMGNSFAVCGFPLYADLISAAFVCAHTWEENQKLLRSRWRRSMRLRVWGILAGKFNIIAQSAILFSHIYESSKLPETASNGGVRHLLSEWHTRLFVYLRGIGYSDSQILNMPLATAQTLFIAYLEDEDKVTFKSRQRLEVEAEMTRIVEEMEADDRKEFAA